MKNNQNIPNKFLATMRERERETLHRRNGGKQAGIKKTFEYPQEAQPDWDFDDHAQNDCLVHFFLD